PLEPRRTTQQLAGLLERGYERVPDCTSGSARYRLTGGPRQRPNRLSDEIAVGSRRCSQCSDQPIKAEVEFRYRTSLGQSSGGLHQVLAETHELEGTGRRRRGELRNRPGPLNRLRVTRPIERLDRDYVSLDGEGFQQKRREMARLFR